MHTGILDGAMMVHNHIHFCFGA